MQQLTDLKNSLDEKFDEYITFIEDAFRDECRNQVNKADGDYSVCGGMGCFAVYLDGEPIDHPEMPRKFQHLDRFWDSIVDSYGYYMTVELTEKEKECTD